MLTYSGALSTLQQLSGVLSTDTTGSALLIQFWNDSRRTVAAMNGGKWPWLEIQESVRTVADQEYVEIPNHIGRVMSVRQQNGSSSTDVIYIPRMIFDSNLWDQVLAQLLGSSDVPYFVYQRNDRLYIQPIPSTTGNYVWLRGRLKIKDINIADVTSITVADTSYSTTFTGVVASGATSATLSGAWGLSTDVYQVTFSNGDVRLVTLTNGATTATWDDALSSSATATITVAEEGGGSILTLSGSATADFVGRWIRITQTSAAGGGDGYWYEIGAYHSATLIGLTKPYQGTELSAATAASTIGFITYEPEQYQMAPIYRALAQYWDFKENDALALKYWQLYDGGFERGKRDSPGGMISQMLEEANESMEGPYISPTPRTGEILGYPPYWLPYNDASGLT